MLKRTRKAFNTKRNKVDAHPFPLLYGGEKDRVSVVDSWKQPSRSQ